MNRDFKGVWIPKEIYLDTRLNALEKIVLVEIDSLDDGEHGCYASNQYLAEFCQCSVTKVSTAVSKLIDLGYIELESFDGRRRVLKSRFSFFERQNLKKEKADFKKRKGSLNNLNNKESNIDNNTERETKAPQTVPEVIAEYTDNETLANALLDFAKMRKAKKKPLNRKQMQLLFEKLLDMANTEKERVAIVNQSIMNGWLDVYPLKNSEQPKRGSSVRGRTPSYDIDALQQKANRPDNYVYKKKT